MFVDPAMEFQDVVPNPMFGPFAQRELLAMQKKKEPKRKVRDDDDDDNDDGDDANATPRRRKKVKTAKESLAETEPQSPPEYWAVEMPTTSRSGRKVGGHLGK